MRKSDHQQIPAVIDDLRLLYRNLEIIRGGIVVAAAAQVLEHLVGERLTDQIGRAAQLLTALGATESPAMPGEGRVDNTDPSGVIREFTQPWPRVSAGFLNGPHRDLPERTPKPSGTFDLHSQVLQMYMYRGPLVSMDRTLRGRGKTHASAGLWTGAPRASEAAGIHAGGLCAGM